ncbi:hypothetical protein QL285_026178 [Trifolium repens]|nr:hypothetical protein QL285_026178 [Trifolium repens]
MAKSSLMASDSYAIPWSCLPFLESAPIAKQPISKPSKSFADAVTNVCDIPTNQFPIPCFKGDAYAIPIPEDEYLAGLETCKHNLHARIIWPKGTTPPTVMSLRDKLKTLWKGLGRWGVMSLGKGFYEFAFSSLEDVRRVRSVASWNLNPGLLKLFAWSNDFIPSVQQNTSAQIWVRLYGLAQEYWRPKIIFAIASSIGTPICIDAASNKSMFDRTFGHYARVLVDIDFSRELRYKVLVERKGFAFLVDLDYENIPDFCTFCKTVGHHVGMCRRMKPIETEKTNKVEVGKKKEAVTNRVEHGTETWKEKEKIVVDIDGSTSNSKDHSLPKDNTVGQHEKISASGDVDKTVHPISSPSQELIDVPNQCPAAQVDLNDRLVSIGGDLLLKHVEEVHTVDATDIQNPPPWCGVISDEFLNSNVDQDLAILKQYWEFKDAREQRVYTDEEEREAAINFLKSRAATGEVPFTTVVSKAKKKKNMQKGFQVHNTRSRGSHPD